MYIVLLNGPPRCGKDTLADLLAEQFAWAKIKFAQPLREAVPAAFGISLGDWEELIETRKSEPLDELHGMTPREAQIWLSEEVLKPRFGDDFFGKVAANRIEVMGSRGYVVSDSGFVEEALVLKERFGAKNLCLLRLHRDECTFEGDSRSYIYLTDVYSADIDNNGSKGALFDIAARAILPHIQATTWREYAEKASELPN